MKKSRGYKSGFTLVELVVTLGIMGLVTGSALVNAKHAGFKRELVAATETIRSQIYRARAEALAPSINQGRSVVGYGLHFISNGSDNFNQYQIVAYKTDPISGLPIAISEEQISRFHAGIVVKPTPFTTDIVFDTAQGGKVILPTNGVDGKQEFEFYYSSGASDERLKLVLWLATGQVDSVEN